MERYLTTNIFYNVFITFWYYNHCEPDEISFKKKMIVPIFVIVVIKII